MGAMFCATEYTKRRADLNLCVKSLACMALSDTLPAAESLTGTTQQMPIYEFECAACGTRFDRLQKLSDPDPVACPHCAAARVRRRLTAPAFRLSGSGWYETDFKKDGDKKRNLAGKDEAPKATAEATPKGDGAGKPEKPATGEPAGAAKKASEPVKPKGDSAPATSG